MADLLIHNARVHESTGERGCSSVLVDGGRIVAVNPPEPAGGAGQRLDAGGRLLTPGLIDLHIHGVEQHLFESNADALVDGVAALAKFGVTTVLPTLYHSVGPTGLEVLATLVDNVGRPRSPGAPV